MEHFKSLESIGSNYAISNKGYVLNVNTGKIVTGATTNYGYKRLWFKHIKKSYFLHRLVAEAFITNKNQYEEVNHIDSNRLNNSAENLEWCNRSQNIKHSFDYGSKSNSNELNPMAKLSKENITNILKLKSNGLSASKISKYFNVSIASICNVIAGRTWSENQTNRDNQQPSPAMGRFND